MFAHLVAKYLSSKLIDDDSELSKHLDASYRGVLDLFVLMTSISNLELQQMIEAVVSSGESPNYEDLPPAQWCGPRLKLMVMGKTNSDMALLLPLSLGYFCHFSNPCNNNFFLTIID